MAQITIKNTAGKDAGTVELDDHTFGIQPNVPVMHQVVTAQLAARRAGTQSTKTRAEVRGGGAKPFRQKGTGNARQGSIRAPHYVGGGVALGPKPRSYVQKTPKKMINLALRSALSDRAADGKVVVVDEWGWDAPSTKAAKAALAGLGVDGSALVVVGRDDAAAALSFRNLPEVQLITPGELNAYDVLCNDWVVFTSAVLPGAAIEASSTTTRTADTATEAPATSTTATEAAPVPLADVTGPPASDASVIHPHGDGSHIALRSGAQPAGFPIKGNASSNLYHLPGTAFYGRTDAEVWFATEADAQAAGFTRPESQAGDDAPEVDDVDADAIEVEPYGAGSYVALAGDVQPEGFTIKGNADSMLYHTPDSPFYDRTGAEVWFATEAAAEAAGFSKPASQQASESEKS
ncbi:MAG TPA: 50S ribosomal protein L4 [Ilumatobacter sp.]|nr:50S ribosomal protein L4 [Ilumatobacter sp.]